jgi:hypothetical protein
MVSAPGHVFVTHTPELRNFPANDQKLEQSAAALGYSRKLLGSVTDSFGRRTFEIYTFVVK